MARLFASGNASGVNAQHVRKLRQILAALNTAKEPANMNLPGFQLHPLKDARKEQWAVSVSGNWRVVFGFDDDNATDVDLLDYH